MDDTSVRYLFTFLDQVSKYVGLTWSLFLVGHLYLIYGMACSYEHVEMRLIYVIRA